MTAPTKIRRDMRISVSQHAQIKSAAGYDCCSMNQFVIDAALEKATLILAAEAARLNPIPTLVTPHHTGEDRS